MPGGSTSHAPGLVFQTNPSKDDDPVRQIHYREITVTREGWSELLQPTGRSRDRNNTRTPEELKRKHGYAQSWGIEARLISSEECHEKYPGLNKSMILGGLHIPSDGLALAARATQLLIESTSKAGVRYLEHTVVQASKSGRPRDWRHH